MIFNDCRVQSFGAEGEVPGICLIKLDAKNIALEYEDEYGQVVYTGQAEHPGHYVLRCPDRKGLATLHRMPGSSILEGFWREGDATGMWRIHLPELVDLA
ncbi:hypothetical protein SB751_20320 [Cupriavidus sp. SIMBA_020]|uniref:hypothetical protein n=1 Tax=Cupriavidus sp. SIMBA_020 TaxID=3085766 RepID=UPI00397BF99A